MKKILLCTLLLSFPLLADIYTKCAVCHGEKGEKRALESSERIQGWPAEKIEAALLGYKNNTYGRELKGVMKAVLEKLSKEEIKELSKYISEL